MSWSPPALSTKRLELTSLAESGAALLRSDKKIDLDACAGLPGNWTISLKRSGQPIGSIGFIRWERERQWAEIGFIMKHTERRKGYMSEACEAVIDFGFRVMRLRTIEGRSMPENQASIHLLKKVGMRREGRVRARLSSKGALVDLDVFRIRK
ncbi:MAG: GNAT family N-acetyltransferase [Nitrospiria bacterium]